MGEGPIYQQPAFWSAVAAGASALSALVMVLIQRRNLIESIRPHVVLTNWRREEGHKTEGARMDFLHFGSIENLGRGVAYNVTVAGEEPGRGKRVSAGLNTFRIPILAAGEKLPLDGAMVVQLEGASRWEAKTHIEMFYFDSRGTMYRKRTRLSIFAGARLFGAFELVPGVYQTGWDERTKAAFRWRTRQRVILGLCRWLPRKFGNRVFNLQERF